MEDSASWAEFRERARRLCESAPSFDKNSSERWDSGTLAWLSRTRVLVRQVRKDFVPSAFEQALSALRNGANLQHNSTFILSLLYDVLAEAEAFLGEDGAGGFIPAGSHSYAMKEINRICESASERILFVDPYVDSSFVFKFAMPLNAGLSIQILTDPRSMKPDFLPTFSAWAKEFPQREITAKVSNPKELHDRAIFVDDKSVWTVTQSFKDLAKNSPAVIAEIVGDIRERKLEAYRQLWDEATHLSLQ